MYAGLLFDSPVLLCADSLVHRFVDALVFRTPALHFQLLKLDILT